MHINVLPEYVCVLTICVPFGHLCQKRVPSPGTGVTGKCESPCGSSTRAASAVLRAPGALPAVYSKEQCHQPPASTLGLFGG